MLKHNLPGSYPLLFSQTALFLEESSENLPAGFGEHLRNDFATMVQPCVIEQMVKRMHRTGFRVGCAVNQERDPRLKNRACAHRARFERDVKRASFEPPRPQRLSRLGDGNYLSMCCGIVKLFPLVVRRGNQSPLMYDDRPDRRFFLAKGLFRFAQGELHEMFVHGCEGFGG
jgi:hypothetical protein